MRDITYNEIVETSKKIIQLSQEEKLAEYPTLDEYLYAAATLVKNIPYRLSITVEDYKPPTNPLLKGATGKLPVTDYERLARNVKFFMEEKGRSPNYATSKLGKIAYPSLIYAFARIINFYDTYKRLPNYVQITNLRMGEKTRVAIWIPTDQVWRVSFDQLRRQGTTDVFLGQNMFKAENKTVLENFLKNAEKAGINIHAWIICLRGSDGVWMDPSTETTAQNLLRRVQSLPLDKLKGVHLDYICYPGTAYKYQGATKNITKLVERIRSSLSKDVLLSAAVMPEMSANAYYYGQDYARLSEPLDMIIPMAYKGNYNEDSSWIGKVTKYIKKTVDEDCLIWTGLQTYHSDSDPRPLEAGELNFDVKTALDSGADGVALFKFGLLDSEWSF